MLCLFFIWGFALLNKYYQIIIKSVYKERILYQPRKPPQVVLVRILQLITRERLEYVNEYFVDYSTIDINDIVDIHKYLMKNHKVKK